MVERVEQIPRDWPKSGGLATAPLFPLPHVYLFPGCVMPLHVFEPRYRQMIEDLLDSPGRLVMGTVTEAGARELAGSPPVLPIAGLGEIGRHERLPDGRFLIWLVGLARVCIHEVPSDRMYRKVAIAPVEEAAVDDAKVEPLRARLQKAILARCNEFLNLPADMTISFLADLLLQRLQLPPRVMQTLYAEVDVEQRAEGALREHDCRPLPPPSSKSSAE